MREIGRTLSADAINKIENGRTLDPGAETPKQIRRVDADDVVALALALNVSPLTLLLPPDGDSRTTVHLTEEVAAKADRVWAWGRADSALPPLWEEPDPQQQEDFERLAAPAAVRYARRQPAGRAAEALRDDVFRMLESSQFALTEATGVDEEFQRRLALARASLARLGHELDRAEAEQGDLARRHQERRVQRMATDGPEQ
ncbi:hypothetical protein ABT224_16205 [Streptomyces sp. NPDC001584]|uniref:hypothetical protein n=1 Tax=Streptomyces sp. NPDC001584 TaxID=3154521 RepID=UPI00332DC102